MQTDSTTRVIMIIRILLCGNFPNRCSASIMAFGVLAASLLLLSAGGSVSGIWATTISYLNHDGTRSAALAPAP